MLKSTKIPLPSLEEQRRITEGIEKLKREVKSLNGLQRKVDECIKDLTPAILNEAFKGEL